MRTVLVAWELGGGLGHLLPLAPILERLAGRGIAVWAALRDLSRVEVSWPGLPVRCLQAPHKTIRSPDRIDPLRSYAHILHNSGYSNAGELQSLVQAWRHLMDLIEPDLLLADHAPTALLAARGRSIRRAVFGTGFCCPPEITPLPDFRAWLPPAPEQLAHDEARVLAVINDVLATAELEPLGQISQLLSETDATILTTFTELDVYDRTASHEYYGVWPTAGGATATWPQSEGQRVLAYLKPFKALPQLLHVLAHSACSTVVYMSPLNAQLAQQYSSQRLRFTGERIDLMAATEQCDLAILNGGHGATATMLLGGIPIFQIPLNLEQALNGKSVERMGAGLVAGADQPHEIAQKLSELMHTGRYAQAAQRFSARYAPFEPASSLDRAAQRLERLCTHTDKG